MATLLDVASTTAAAEAEIEMASSEMSTAARWPHQILLLRGVGSVGSAHPILIVAITMCIPGVAWPKAGEADAAAAIARD